MVLHQVIHRLFAQQVNDHEITTSRQRKEHPENEQAEMPGDK